MPSLTHEQLEELTACSTDEAETWLRTFPTTDIISTLLELHEFRRTNKAYHRKAYVKRQLLVKAAARMLDADELKRVDQLAQEVADGYKHG